MGTDALLKVTIIPRTSAALGFAQYTPVDRKLFSPDEFMDRMCMALGGRVAESLTFNKITTGAQNDLDKGTKTVLQEHKDKLEILAERLLEVETLNYDDVVALIGPPPHGKKNLVSPLEYEQRIKEEANLAEKGQGMGGGT